MKLTMKMEEESLLLLLELADKYIDKGTMKKTLDQPLKENEDKINSVESKEENSQQINKSSGEDAEFLLNVLAGEHFYTPDISKIEKMEIAEEKKSGIAKKDEIELVTTPPVFTPNEIVKLQNAKETINKSKNLKMENEDCEMLLQVMDIYMDIYKP